MEAMNHCCLIVFLFIGFSDTYSTFFRHCDSFSAGKCSPEDGTFIGNKPLNDEEACQDGCSIDVRCQDYTFDPIAPLSEQCKWYEDTYRQSCSLYAGNREVNLDVCIGQIGVTDDCDRFLLQDCEYSFSDPIEEATPGSIIDAYQCKEYCEKFTDAGCDFWVFESSETAPLGNSTCKLFHYTFNRNDCPAHHGPYSPHYSAACE